jgi:hypothetical protein
MRSTARLPDMSTHGNIVTMQKTLCALLTLGGLLLACVCAGLIARPSKDARPALPEHYCALSPTSITHQSIPHELFSPLWLALSSQLL